MHSVYNDHSLYIVTLIYYLIHLWCAVDLYTYINNVEYSECMQMCNTASCFRMIMLVENKVKMLTSLYDDSASLILTPRLFLAYDCLQ